MTISGLITAIRFLTIIPVPGRALLGPHALGRSAGWFPVVGLALGASLALEARVLSLAFPPLLSALLVLLTWKLLTGGIHLDGLADSLDGLSGGTPDQRLAVMRDSRIGVFGALGLIAVVSLGFLTLAELAGPLRARAFLVAPPVGRLVPLLLARTCVPATPSRGVGAAFMDAVTRRALVVGSSVVVTAAAVTLWPWGLVAAGVGLAVPWAAARFFSRRLGGLTGDSLGAGVELGELTVLLALASIHHLRLV
ncbi:MAG: adenosylcobinamide-GDP ribazoletransferase [Candidatus Rokubacteria bacterium]|nr:adenosylcobinamide-GDP ribazoletransferase [Candidatus Rokubacteria bacterium]